MEGEAALQILAEVSVALAGFTGVVGAFGDRRSSWTPFEFLRFRVMLGTSLATLLLSLLPFALYHLHLAPGVIWILCSAAYAAYLVTIFPLDVRRGRALGLFEHPDYRAWVPLVLGGSVAVAVALQVLNVAGVGFHREPGPFILGLFLLVVICAFMFVRLLAFVGRDE